MYIEFNDMVNRLTHTVNMNVDAMKADRATWAEQFRNALNVNGGDVENASNFDYAMHFLTFFWKVNARKQDRRNFTVLCVVVCNSLLIGSHTLPDKCYHQHTAYCNQGCYQNSTIFNDFLLRQWVPSVL